jgi:hypothetical protein
MEKQRIIIDIASYANSPGPRYCIQGDDSGEDFYHKILNCKFYDAYTSNAVLVVNLDGPDGYASSFLDEAFGNLIYDFGLKIVKEKVEIISNEEPEWIDMIENETFIEWEERRIKQRVPKKTVTHNPWFRFENGSVLCKNWVSI